MSEPAAEQPLSSTYKVFHEIDPCRIDLHYVGRSVDVPVGGPYGDRISFEEVTTPFTSTVTGDMTLSLINSGNVFATSSADPGSTPIDVSLGTMSAVPEPSEAMTLLLGFGLLGTALVRRRNKPRCCRRLPIRP